GAPSCRAGRNGRPHAWLPASHDEAPSHRAGDGRVHRRFRGNPGGPSNGGREPTAPRSGAARRERGAAGQGRSEAPWPSYMATLALQKSTWILAGGHPLADPLLDLIRAGALRLEVHINLALIDAVQEGHQRLLPFARIILL